MKNEFKINRFFTETGIVIEREGKVEPDMSVQVVLVIAGNPAEFETYKQVHNAKIKSNDVLIYIDNKLSALGVEADYIKIVGSAEKRTDFEMLKETCIDKLKRS